MPFGDYSYFATPARSAAVALPPSRWPSGTQSPMSNRGTVVHALTALPKNHHAALFDSSPEAAATFISGSYMKGSDSHHWRADASRFILRDLATLLVDISHAKWRSKRTAVTPDHGRCRSPTHQGQTVPQRCARHHLHKHTTLATNG